MGSEMNQDPNRVGSGPPGDPPSELLAIDQAMLLALSHRPRGGAPLTVEQETLLDDWVAGRLAPSDADRAAELTKRNGFASERVLERRLIAAAHEGPAVPAALASRVLASRPKERAAAAADASPSRSFSIWSMLSAWQWSGLGAAVAATLVVAAIGLRMWQEPPQARVMQFAMVNIDDRSSFGPPRVRSLQPQIAKDGFQDVDVSADLIRRTIADASGSELVKPAEWSSLLPAAEAGSETQVLINMSVADRLAGDWKSRNSIPVRIYDLADPRWAAIRAQVKNVPPGKRLLLVTQRQ